MIVACHQPVYFASLHLAQRWLAADRIVWLERVQFARKSRDEHGRNQSTGQAATRIWMPGRPEALVLTVPVSESRSPLATTPLTDIAWQAAHLRTLHAAYAQYGWWKTLSDSIEQAMTGHRTLARLNRATWDWLTGTLGVPGPEQLSDIAIGGAASQHVLACCQMAEATEYVAGRPSIAAYLDLPAFADAGIAVRAQDWLAPEYGPLFNGSVLDLVLTVGPDKARALLMEND